MEEKRRASSVEHHHICTNIRTRLYYLVMTGIFAITLFIEVVALGSFGIQFSRTRDFWVNNVNGDSKVCVLYGTVSYTLNPTLTNNAACGFALWALISIVIVLVTWTIYYGILVVLGRPSVTSLARLIDLGMACAMAILSLIVSSVITDGFYKTCGSFNRGIYNLPCNKRNFVAVGNEETLSFFGNLEAAKDASWVVMIIFTLMACWNVVLLFLHCCFKHGIDERAKPSKEKPEPKDFPGYSDEESTEQTEEKEETKDEDSTDSWSSIKHYFYCCFYYNTEEMSKLMSKKRQKLEPLDFSDFPEGEKSRLKRQKAIRKKKDTRDFPDFPEERSELVGGGTDVERMSESRDLSKDFPDSP